MRRSGAVSTLVRPSLVNSSALEQPISGREVTFPPLSFGRLIESVGRKRRDHSLSLRDKLPQHPDLTWENDMRLASKVQDILGEAGVEVLTSLTGDRTHAQVTLLEPNNFSRAQKALRTAGLGVRRLMGATLEIGKFTQTNDEDDDPEFETLISSWRTFAQKSAQGGYRKASRISSLSKKIRSPGYNPIAAAEQVALATMNLAGRSPVLRKLAAMLHQAAKSKDKRRINKILAELSTGPMPEKPIMRSPTMAPAELDDSNNMEDFERVEEPRSLERDDLESGNKPQKQSPQQRRNDHPVQSSLRRARRKAVAKTDTINRDAEQFLLSHINENSLGVEDINALIEPGCDTRQSFVDSYEEEDQGKAAKAWDNALKAFKKEAMQERVRESGDYMGEEGGEAFFLPEETKKVDASNHGFVVSSAMDMTRSVRELILIAGEVVEDYAAEKAPEKITDGDVKKFLKANYPDISFDRIKTFFERVVKGIPNRYEDDKKESSRRVLEQSRERKGARVSRVRFCQQ